VARERWPEGELPPDPWAGLADDVPPFDPHRAERRDLEAPDARPDERPPHPSEARFDLGGPPLVPGSRSPLQRPGLWVALVLLALVLLVAAVLDGGGGSSQPSPGSITALGPSTSIT
jgi:hypothetical protein